MNVHILAPALALLGLLTQCPSLCGQSAVVFVDHSAIGANSGGSWQDAFVDLQDALTIATSGTQIWVADGVYRPDGGTKFKNLAFELRSGVEAYGGFQGTEISLGQRNPNLFVTTLSGDLKSDDIPEQFQTGISYIDNSWHVVRASSVDSSSVLDGFQIKGGVGVNSVQGLCGQQAGAGILLSAATPLLRNCVITMNRSFSCGSGAYFLNGSDAVVEKCVFKGNLSLGDGGGAVAMCEASPIFLDCTFEGNLAPVESGGAVLVGDGCNPVFERCWFVENTAFLGGAVYLELAAPQISNSVFVGNSSAQGGALLYNAFEVSENGNGFVKNSAFCGNSAGDGGAIAMWNCAAVVEACTIANNSAGQLGGGVLIAGTPAGAALESSVVWGNTDAGFEGKLGAQIYVATIPPSPQPISYCCVEGLLPTADGEGNIGQDPSFADLDGDDDSLGTLDDEFAVVAGSPCIDAGATSGETSGISLDGNPRLLDGNLDGVMVPDIGAVEFTNVRLSVGQAATGDSLSVEIQAKVSLWGFLIIGLGDAETPVAPFGLLLVDPSLGMTRLFVGQLPFEASFQVPSAMAIPRALKFQCIGLKTGAGAGNFSNAVWVMLEFA